MNTDKTMSKASAGLKVAHSQWYAALDRGSKHYIVFQSRIEPTEATHPEYAFCFGPYKTQKQAATVAQYQSYGNAQRVTISNSDR